MPTAGHQDAQLMGLLVKVFKKTSFKDWQLRVISATLGGKDTLVVQPTQGVVTAIGAVVTAAIGVKIF